jgi:hypothetical protein
MNLKKLTAITLTAALMLSNTVFASSVNTINKTVTVRKETAITDLYLKIEPRDEVETGSSIIINYVNATVPDQDVIDGKSSAKSKDGYKSGGYQYQGYNWDGSTGFYDVMSSIDSYEMPYIIKRTNSHQIEIFLLNMPGSYADSYLTEINGNKMEPIYRVNLPIITADEGDVGISIDSNSTSISDSVLNGATIYKKGSTTTSSSVTTDSTVTTEETTETTTEAVNEDEDNDTVSKSDKTTVVKITIGSDDMEADGKTYAVDVPAYIQKSSSSTLVPLRMVSVALGGGNVENADNSDMVKWNAETKTAEITCGDTTVSFTAGSNAMVVNGEETV